MTEYAIETLEGDKLCRAVLEALKLSDPKQYAGAIVRRDGLLFLSYADMARWQPFNPLGWTHGGPLVEQYRITIRPIGAALWSAYADSTPHWETVTGNRPLVAAMRALVYSIAGSHASLADDNNA